MRELVYNGTAIHQDDKLISITDMWRAAGSVHLKRPNRWYRTAGAKAFINQVAADLKMSKMAIWQSRAGRHGSGSWAHWQIAMAYAQYLDPKFHMWCNTAVRAVMEGRAQAGAEQVEMLLPPPASPVIEGEDFTREDGRKAFDWVHRNMKALHDQTRAELKAALAEAISEFWRGVGHLKNKALTPEHLLASGVLMLPAPTPDTNFMTAFETCKRVIPEKVIHSRLPNVIGHVLSAHAKEHRWPQGWTEKRGLSAKRLNTYPESRVMEWLAAGGAALIEHENDRLRQEEAVKAGALPLRQTA